MRVLVGCKRGGLGPRDKWGHCLCPACRKYTADKQRERGVTQAKRAWIVANREKVSAYSKKWLDANKEKRRDIEKSWKSRNPDRVAQYSNRAGAKWSKNNKGRRNAIGMKRVAAKLQRTPVWADLDAMREFYDRAAAISAETRVPHEVDHIYPLQGETVCGLHVPENLQIIPRSINRSKRNRLVGVPSEY